MSPNDYDDIILVQKSHWCPDRKYLKCLKQKLSVGRALGGVRLTNLHHRNDEWIKVRKKLLTYFSNEN